MSGGTFVVGDRVDVHIRGAVVSEAGRVMLRVESGPDDYIHFAPSVDITVEKSAPKGWPPQVGDIWADKDGDEWVATSQEPDSAVRLYLVDYDRSSLRSADELSDLQPMRLLRRREVPDA